MNAGGMPLRWMITSLLMGAAIVVLYATYGCDAPEAALRHTDGIRVVVVNAGYAPHGRAVRCEVTNDTGRRAESIAMTVELLDENQQVLAVNPLVNVRSLLAGESRVIDAMVPLENRSVEVHPRASVALVKWE